MSTGAFLFFLTVIVLGAGMAFLLRLLEDDD